MDVLPAQHHMCRDNKQTTKKRIDWVKKKKDSYHVDMNKKRCELCCDR
jgi:hypothetical protein